MKIALVLTNDWELFGDGSGDYYEIQHKPLQDFLGLLEEYNAKLTVMAEVGQQLSHKKANNETLKEIASSWEKILKETIEKGHDVQLHYHPQWDGSEYTDGKWKLSENWAIAKYSPDKINQFISGGKNYLESLLQPVNPNYKCNCFRAGAYYIEPSEEVLKSLRKHDFICDTSVTKGMKSEGYFDYTNAHSNVIPWNISENDIKIPGDAHDGLMEFPIYSFRGIDSDVLKKFLPDLYYQLKYGRKPDAPELKWAKERNRIKNLRYPPENRLYKKAQKKNFSWYMRAILSKKYTQLDYDYLPATIFVDVLKNILNDKLLNSKYDMVPVIASGHVKDMFTAANAERIFRLIKSELSLEVEYRTLSEVVKYWKEK